MAVVVTQRDKPSVYPAQVVGPEVVVRKVQFPQGRLQGVERREQPVGRLRMQRFGNRFACGQVLEYQVETPFTAGRVGPPQFAPQDTVLREPFGVEASELRCRALDRGQRDGRKRHREQPLPAAPGDLGFGETCRAHQPRQAVHAGCGPGVGERLERKVGRQQCPGEDLQRRCHGYSVFTLMDPMLSMVISSSAEALKLMPRNGGRAPGPLASRIASLKTSGMGLEQS